MPIPGFEVTVLGCGPSMGVPVIGCDCPVCTSGMERNNRTRTSILLTVERNRHIVVDTTPDFRAQLLREGVKRLSYVLYTHLHADHCHGFDDLRGLYFFGNTPVTCYLDVAHLAEMRRRFSYAFEKTSYVNARPEILLEAYSDNLELYGLPIETMRFGHGGEEVIGFKIGRFAYVTDFKEFPEAVREQWRGQIDTMVASALRREPHPTHSSIGETIQIFDDLKVRRGVLVHMSHAVDYYNESKNLPYHVELAHDGLKIQIAPV